jgi:hypothetical protein
MSANLENVARQQIRGRVVARVPKALPTYTHPVADVGSEWSIPEGLSASERALFETRNLLAPDNWQEPHKWLTSQVNAGQAYDYGIPKDTRKILITNRSALANLYYWYDSPSNGQTKLPQNYNTLLPTQSFAENSRYGLLTLFADASSTDQGWEYRFSWLKTGTPAVGKDRRAVPGRPPPA